MMKLSVGNWLTLESVSGEFEQVLSGLLFYADLC